MVIEARVRPVTGNHRGSDETIAKDFPNVLSFLTVRASSSRRSVEVSDEAAPALKGLTWSALAPRKTGSCEWRS